MKALIGSFLTIVGGVFVVSVMCYSIWGEEAEEVPPTLLERCANATVEWSGLNACDLDGMCNLSNQEVSDLYTLNKKSLIYCTMSITKTRIESIKGEAEATPEPEEVPEIAGL